MQFTQFIDTVLREASIIANEKFGKVIGTTKSEDNNQVLTEADILLGKLIVSRIQKTYPHHNIIDEEAGVIDKKSEYTWVIDPIDGTSNFANGVHQYGIMLGLLFQDVPLAGGISIPYFKETYLAEKGSGTFVNGKRTFVTTESQLSQVLVSYTLDGHPEKPELSHEEGKIIGELVMHIRNLRAGSTAYDVPMLVSGRYGGHLNRTSKIWDSVAPHIITTEAGGKVTDFWGDPIDYTDALEKTQLNFTECAASPVLHEQLQKIVHSLKFLT